MKNLLIFGAILVVCLSAAEISRAQTEILITGDSAGKIKLGMTVAEARKAMKGFNFERTSDGEGVALIGINKDGSEYIMTIYAGEDDSEAKIDENAKIEFIEVWFANYKTAEGVHPRMKVSDVEKKYGKVKEIMLSEIESREFAEFGNQPKGLQFRLMNDNATAGVYPNGKSKTMKYSPDAYLLSIQVVGITEFEENSKTIDVSDFNQKIAQAAANDESWIKFPTQVIAHWLPKFEEFGFRSIEMKSEFADVTGYLEIVVTDDNYADDSVRGARYWIEIEKDDKGIWQIASARKAWICRQNRGHQDYSIAPCI